MIPRGGIAAPAPPPNGSLPPMAGAPGALGAAEPAKPKSDKIPFYKKEFHIGKAVKGEELMNFSRQTASFLRAGIPVIDALAVLSEDNDNKEMVRVLSDIRTNLQQGGGLGDSLSSHPKVFPSYYVAMVRSAELTGRLDDTMDQLAGYLEHDQGEAQD